MGKEIVVDGVSVIIADHLPEHSSDYVRGTLFVIDGRPRYSKRTIWRVTARGFTRITTTEGGLLKAYWDTAVESIVNQALQSGAL